MNTDTITMYFTDVIPFVWNFIVQPVLIYAGGVRLMTLIVAPARKGGSHE